MSFLSHLIYRYSKSTFWFRSRCWIWRHMQFSSS